jgi:CelD/BcsL family acetyltransferase involved in cellulose biosynthesis
VAREWDYNDFLVGNDIEEQTKAVLEFLSQTSSDWDILDCRDLRDTGNAIEHIKSALACAGLPYRVFREEQRCPYMLLDSPWSEMMNRHSRSSRRTFRKFSTLTPGELRVRVVENPQREPRLLEKLIAVEAQKHVGGKLSAPFLGKYSDVFQMLFDKLGSQGWISIVLLESKDRLVAWQFLYRCGKSLWGYLNAHDHAFSGISPGTMLIPATIDYGFVQGFEEFDFLSGEESYKMRWSTGFHHTYRLVIWSRLATSKLRAFAYLKLRVRNPR